MKNKILFSMMLFLLACFGAVRADVVQIGETGSLGDLPLKAEFPYFLTQQIYDADEIGTPGTISAISFYFVSTEHSGSFSMDGLQLYLKNVDKDVFTSDTDMVPLSASDKVWEGTYTATGTGWVTITLDTPFEYDGTSNLLVGVYDPTDYCSGGTYRFYVDESQANKALGYYGHINPDLSNLPNYQGYNWLYEYRPIIQIDITNPNIVEIGDDTDSGYNLPVNMYYNYSLTQQIYTAEEIGRAGTIKSIAFDYAYSGAFSMPEIQVYMKHVDKSEFAHSIDMVDLSDATFVYEGTFAAEGAGWVTLTLDHPFEYDGTSNLLVCFYDPTNGYPGSAYKFRYTSTTGYTSLAYYGDNSNPDLDHLNTYSGNKYRYQYRANIRLDFTPTTFSCEAPGYITVSFTDFNRADIYWENVTSGYWVETKKAGEVWAPFVESIIGQGIVMINLDEGTTYFVRVRSVCVDGSTSAWTLFRFTTPLACPGPINLHVEELSTNHAWLSWGVPSGASSRTEYKKATDSEWIVLNDHSGAGYVLYNLEPMTTYDFRVLLYCQNGYTSDYETIQFTTAVPLPITETFSSTSLPTGWRKGTGLLDEVMAGLPLTSSGYWNFGTQSGVFDGSTHAYVNIYGTSCKYWLLTPFVVLTENCQLGFDVAYTDYSGTMVDPATDGDDDKFVILISTDFGASWEILRTYANDGSSDYTLNDFTPQSQKVVLDLSNYDNQTVQLAFYVESTEYNADNYLHIDNVNVDQVYTVNDGTNINYNVPVYGIWVDRYSKSQFIIPAEVLVAIQYGEISKLTFYCSVDAIDWGAAQFEVYMAEVDNTTFASTEFVDWGSLQLVRSAGSLSVVGGLMEVELDTPFNYTEGNLMVGIKQTVSGTYKSCSWYGVNTDSNTAIGGYENARGINFQQFLPKTTFNYTTTSCKTPTNFAAEVISGSEVTFNWTPGEGQNFWQIAVGNADTFDPNNYSTYLMFENVPEGPPYTLSGLQPWTTYKACVRTHCGHEVSPWSRVITFTTTPCLPPTNLVATTTNNAATFTWDAPENQIEWVVSIDWAENGDYPPEFTTNEPSYTITKEELDEILGEDSYDVPFTVSVQGYCGQADGWSDNTEEVEFTIESLKLTINDGTTTNEYVPIYGYYCDEYSRSQFIIPAESLEAMQFSEISKMTFYSSNTNVSWGDAEFEVYMMELPCQTEFESAELYDWVDMELVRSEGSLSIVDGQMVVELEEPYFYTDGNLMIGFKQTESGTYVHSYWYGVNSGSNASVGGYESSKGLMLYSFLPKTTFSYTPIENMVCAKPTDLVIEQTTNSILYLTWTSGNDNQSMTQIAWGVENFDPSDNSTWLNSDETISYGFFVSPVEPETTYYFSLRSVCDEGIYGNWTCPVAFTTAENCPTPSNVTFTNITPNQATVHWEDAVDSTWVVMYEALNCMTYDFEDQTLQGWTSQGDATWEVGVGDYYSTPGAHSGNYNAKITHTVNGNETWLISPMISSGGQTHGEVSFWYINRNWSGDVDELAVYYRSEGGEWLALQDIIMAHETWTESVAYFEILSDNYQIGFKMVDHYGYGVGLDDIRIYSNQYVQSMYVNYTDTYTFTGLEPNTTYWIYMIAVCNGLDSDIVDHLFFTTLSCVAKSLPYTYGFENENEFGCWSMVNCHTSSGISPNAGHASPHGFRFYYSNDPPQYLISPELTGTENGVHVEFDYKNLSSDYPETFQVGYSTTDDDIDSFVWEPAVTASNGQWSFYSTTFPAGTKYVAVSNNSYDQYFLYLDDFSFTAPESITQTVALTAGWNWFSSNVEITLNDLKAALVAALPGATSIKIQSQSDGNTTYNGNTWRGQLSTINLSQMYMIQVASACQITLEGTPINPADHPVTIHNGTNWIAFPLSGSMSLTDAFAGFVVNGDQVVSQDDGNATYTNRWRGTLNTLEPGKGYLYKTAVTGTRTFTFPTGAK